MLFNLFHPDHGRKIYLGMGTPAIGSGRSSPGIKVPGEGLRCAQSLPFTDNGLLSPAQGTFRRPILLQGCGSQSLERLPYGYRGWSD